MKILITFLTYGINAFGGVEKSIYNLIQGLKKVNIEPIVFTGNINEKSNIADHKIYYSNYLINNFAVEDINSAIMQNYYKYHSEIKAELLKIIQSEKPDYILAVDHIWGIIPHIDIFDDISCPIGIVFHMLHDNDILSKVFNFPFKHIFAISNYVKSGLKKFNKSKTNIYLLPNCISEDFFTEQRKNACKKLFCNARIAEGKGIDILIKAFLKILDKYPQCELYLCNGDFYFMKKMKIDDQISEINKNLRCPKIIMLPNIKWDDISKTLQSMDVVILPTEMETFGLGALETIASSIPLITTRVGNLPDLLEDAAFYIDNISSYDIVNTVSKVFTQKDLVSKKVKMGFQIAQKYLDSKVAFDLVEVISGGKRV